MCGLGLTSSPHLGHNRGVISTTEQAYRKAHPIESALGRLAVITAVASAACVPFAFIVYPLYLIWGLGAG